jgi:hypothetical protein
MKEELLEKVGTWVATTAEQIGDFASREIPPFIHEYLMWKFWESIVNIGIHIIILGIIAIGTFLLNKLVRFLWQKHLNGGRNDNWDFGAIISGLLGTSALIGFVITWICNFPVEDIKDCVQIKLAPEVYLVEKAAEIYKNNK